MDLKLYALSDNEIILPILFTCNIVFYGYCHIPMYGLHLKKFDKL